MQTARYGAVIVFGFAVDFGITLALSIHLGLQLWLAATIGYLSALLLNYALFEFWAFGRDNAAFSSGRLLQTAIASVVALSVRLAVIKVAQQFLGTSAIETSIILLMGAGASVAVNFLLVRSVFAAR
jgi:putative flippase GtrA